MKQTKVIREESVVTSRPEIRFENSATVRSTQKDNRAVSYIGLATLREVYAHGHWEIITQIVKHCEYSLVDNESRGSYCKNILWIGKFSFVSARKSKIRSVVETRFSAVNFHRPHSKRQIQLGHCRRGKRKAHYFKWTERERSSYAFSSQPLWVGFVFK